MDEEGSEISIDVRHLILGARRRRLRLRPAKRIRTREQSKHQQQSSARSSDEPKLSISKLSRHRPARRQQLIRSARSHAISKLTNRHQYILSTAIENHSQGYLSTWQRSEPADQEEIID